MVIEFEITSRDRGTKARGGKLTVGKRQIETPAFMPVGTQASVKGQMPSEIVLAGHRIICLNSYHLLLRPGVDIIRSLGGLHKFMCWDYLILTDSGGFQVYSMAPIKSITDDGISFTSHIDGSKIDLTPELSISIQEEIGTDIAMALDVCPTYTLDRTEIERAVNLTNRWAERAKSVKKRDDIGMFGIIQGGVFMELREESAEKITSIGFDGYAVGGLSVGEPRMARFDVAECLSKMMPQDKVRYVMGIGFPEEIIKFVSMGYDLFDCVLPTRCGRNGLVFTKRGLINLRRPEYRTDKRPLEDDCPCPACKNFSRAYLSHLFRANEMLAPRLLSLHNLYYYGWLFDRIRENIRIGTLESFSKEFYEIDI
ncbi:MAG: tRNA guanosine(34) transglycosylase Tgt [bacterium]